MSTILSVENADSVLTSLGSSGRVKYSCVGISKNYLVLGATTGSVYLIKCYFVIGENVFLSLLDIYFFERATLTFVRVISSAGILRWQF
jgi:hypothetical protein